MGRREGCRWEHRGVGAEMGQCRLLCGEPSSSGAAAGLRATQLLSGPARWEISKSFTEGLASLRPVRDKETQRRRDLPKVPLRREQKPGHPWSGPVEPPQLLGCCRVILLCSTAWQCLPCLGIQLLRGPKGLVQPLWHLRCQGALETPTG